ncbi:helix-turn-helix transcriptional regulator [Oceanospirillum sediminis]|uniref:Helix-turn-helix transcriptional regulator n=1 Tax=Oceanospirillum sediminis TaxID=2760088 RepID=A0A839IXV5_9GAMM|nr:helix-turn-helix transcriptional regulator [Oceanospirillum sediminis]MBB1489510.1 helix-turn-helix transcriptional regulator [Oceanospirillum sediminis]
MASTTSSGDRVVSGSPDVQHSDYLLSRLWFQSQQLMDRPQEGFPALVFHCRDMQSLHRVHFYQPTLLLVLKGAKRIESPYDAICPQGNLLLIAQGSEFPFSNIPDDVYTALVICFQPDDFPFAGPADHTPELDIVQACNNVLTVIEQMMSLADLPADNPDIRALLWQQRRRELAQILTVLNQDKVLRVTDNPGWKQKLADLLQTDLSSTWQINEVCQMLAISESSLRRRLKEENTGFRELLEDLRLTHGLGLLQTTQWPVNQVALSCGYQSASRFSERFRKRFRISPAELRKAR